MCGIVGILGKEPVAEKLWQALKRLEYRGYDSAGIATLSEGRIHRRRAQGKLENLALCLQNEPLGGAVGIGHTRWATHGAPTERNAHPHATDRVAIVHNGIIENFRELREELEAAGVSFETETDSEVVAHLITRHLAAGLPPVEAAAAVFKRLDGAFALGIIFRDAPELMVGARRGSPLAVGYGDGEMYLGSDAIALAGLTNRLCYLEDGDWVALGKDRAVIYDETGAEAVREIKVTAVTPGLIEKGRHRHFMAKEIFEQPEVIGHTLSEYINPMSERVDLPVLPFDLGTVPKITLVGCGTACYAAMAAKYWFEQIARLSVEVDIASEFRYREAPLPEGGLAIFISQSGETADTLAALRYCRNQGQHVAAVVNVPDSSIAREADVLLPTHAGPEIGVASTKAFTCQLSVMAALAIAAGRARGALTVEQERALVRGLLEVPRHVADVLKHDKRLESLGYELSRATDILYLGRGIAFPIALEGALKLKEISYIHAEGYAAGELKHGPIALIDEDVPVVVLAPSGRLYEKTISNMHEVVARGGRVILISDEAGIENVGNGVLETFAVPSAASFVTPLLYAIPVQLLAYHTAVAKGTDVDQPRNLAKSVTVE